jgi:hypothetical protein
MTPAWYPDPWGIAPLRWWDGAAWTGHVSGAPSIVDPMASLDLDKERDAGRQVRWAAWMIAAGHLLTVVSFAVMALGLAEVIRFAVENPSSDEVPPGSGVIVGAFVGSALASPLGLLGLVLLLIWLHRAVGNGISLGFPAPREPAMAVVSWFIPVVNFWWPYESLRECVDPHDTATRALIKRWWVVYLGAGFGFLVTPLAVLWTPLIAVVGAGAVGLVIYEARLLQQVVESVLASHSATANR